MTRRKGIFIITHIYPVWITTHLILGDWSRPSQLAFNIVPLIIFGGLLTIWAKSKTPLQHPEKICIYYLVFMLFCISVYYNICVMSNAEWVTSHNTQAAGFIFLQLIFYIFIPHEPK